MLGPSPTTRGHALGAFAASLFFLIVFYSWVRGVDFIILEDPLVREELGEIHSLVDQWTASPPQPDQFAVQADRLQALGDWLEIYDHGMFNWTRSSRLNLTRQIESTALAHLPFLRDPLNLKHPAPLRSLRESYLPDSRGIVIPTGKDTFRFACHTVGMLRDVLGSRLPIEIVHAGDEDLPEEYREAITALAPDVNTLDITTIFDDPDRDITGWSIKPFAALGSSFEQIVLMDADTVFVQDPEVLFEGSMPSMKPKPGSGPPRTVGENRAYPATGTIFFHDRLVWRNLSMFQERHDFWRAQLTDRVPTPSLRYLKAYHDNWAEEQDSGVVVLDKRRISVFVGLLHTCWQNVGPARRITESKTHGDKETWWLGFELVGAPYAFASRYAGIIGDLTAPKRPVKELQSLPVGLGTGNEPGVCSFVTSHADARGALLWYHGSLLRNKHRKPREFTVHTHWMQDDGAWEHPFGKAIDEPSCMRNGAISILPEPLRDVMARGIERAQEIDVQLGSLAGSWARG